MKTFQDFRAAIGSEFSKELSTLLLVDNPDFDKIAKCIARDPSLAANLIKAGNSALFTSSGYSLNLKTCVARIGITACTTLCLSEIVSRAFQTTDQMREPTKAFLIHGFFTSQVACRLARICGIPGKSDALQIAGLLHDIGILFRFYSEPEKIDDILKIANASHLSISEAERILKTGTHGMTGVYISRECWQLPREVEELIALHETVDHGVREKRTARSLSNEEHKAFETLSLADTLAHRFGYAFPVFQRDVRVSTETMEILGLSKETLLATVKQTKAEVEELEFGL